MDIKIEGRLSDVSVSERDQGLETNRVEEFMEVTTRIADDVTYVKVTGAVDTPAAEVLRMELNKVAAQKPKRVIMDLSMVPTMGSSGIGKILMFYKNLDAARSKFEIKGIHDNLISIFKAVKLDKLFPISQK